MNQSSIVITNKIRKCINPVLTALGSILLSLLSNYCRLWILEDSIDDMNYTVRCMNIPRDNGSVFVETFFFKNRKRGTIY